MSNKGLDFDFKVHAGLVIAAIVVLVIAAKMWARNHLSIGMGHPHF